MTKEKVIELASMYGQLEPDVAKKLLEQLPEFTKTLREAVFDLKGVVEKALETNDNTTRQCMETCSQVLNALEMMLKDETLSFEGKSLIMGRMQDVLGYIDKLDERNKRLIMDTVKTVARTVVGIAALAVVAFGGKAILPDGMTLPELPKK